MTRFFAAIAACLFLSANARADDAAARGRYLAILGDCAGCHTAAGEPAFAGGLSFNAPFGTLYSTNITPDRDTGIGTWKQDDFYRALHEGIAPGERHLYPAFPYIYFTRISRQESDDLFAYLHSLKPVHRPPTANKLMFPFNLRFGMVFWNWLYLDKISPQPPAGAGAAWKRGEYLVSGLGHCAACHTPKNLLFGDEKAWPLAGGTVDGWYAPDITNSAVDGLGKWTHGDVTTFLVAGRNRLTTVAGSMKEKVTTSTSHMLPTDIAAIATYLKSLSSPQPPPWEKPRREEMAQGRGVYQAQCQRCHGADGVAHEKDDPSLAANTMVISRDPTTVLRIILTGGATPEAAGRPPRHAMPAFNGLNDGDIAAVANYTRNAWGNSAPPVSATEVHNLRRALNVR